MTCALRLRNVGVVKNLPMCRNPLEKFLATPLWSRYAISLYSFLQFIPTTLIFLCFVVFRFRITSGQLLGYVLFCQITIAEITYHYSFIYDYIKHHVFSFLKVLFDLSLTLSQFWSLQFLKAVILPFCVGEKLTGIHVNMLNFVMYPLVLVIISCILMELHARNYRIVGILWRFSGTSVSCGVVVISPLVTPCVHTVDHVDGHAMQYRHVRYVRAIESDTHASRVRRARILIVFQPRPLLDPSSPRVHSESEGGGLAR